MKKIVFMLIGLSIFTVGCENKTIVSEIPKGSDRFSGIDVDYIKIITDSETGCKYIYTEDSVNSNNETATMSPLYKSDGSVDCE